jgi:hypothetical protein
MGKIFSDNFGFPLPVIIPPLIHIHLSSRAGTIDPSDVIVLRASVSPHAYKKKKKT